MVADPLTDQIMVCLEPLRGTARTMSAAQLAKALQAERDAVARALYYLTAQGKVLRLGERRAYTYTLSDEPAEAPRYQGLPEIECKTAPCLRLAISDQGELQMGDADDPARWVFTPEQTLALGDFLALTEGLWRP